MGPAPHDHEEHWLFDALDLRPVERWLSSLAGQPEAEGPPLSAVAQPPRRLADTYLDTADWRLWHAGYLARVRRRGRRDDITLASVATAWRDDSGMSEELAAAGFEGLDGDGPVGWRVRAMAGRSQVGTVLTARTRRRPFVLRLGPTVAGRVELDDTEIGMGNGQRPMLLRRVRIVAAAPWADTVRPVVAQLRLTCGLREATLCELEAGLLARGTVIAGPPDLGPTELAPQTSLGDMAFAVLRRQLGLLRATEPGTRLGEDPLALHDMRVATRRLRAALDLYVTVLPIRARAYRVELGWMASVLGSVRDLDVARQAQSAMTDPAQADLWAELDDLLRCERDEARRQMLGALNSARWERLITNMVSMVQQGPLRRSVAARQPALAVMPSLIVARHDAVVKAARRAKRSGQAADFHHLRIKVKRLRYSIQFSRELYGGHTKPYSRRLATVQEHLGLFQDAEVAARHLEDLAQRLPGLSIAAIFAMGGAAAGHRHRMDQLMERLPSVLSKLRGPEWAAMTATLEHGRARSLALAPPEHRPLHIVRTPVRGADPDVAAPSTDTSGDASMVAADTALA